MLYVVETAKDVETAAHDLEEAAKRNKFGVLHVHDLQQKMKEKGVEFPNACRILEVCNPHQASRILSHNMAVSLALPVESPCTRTRVERRLARSSRRQPWRFFRAQRECGRLPRKSSVRSSR
jgi:uncharacterized protein (DUF302 family)